MEFSQSFEFGNSTFMKLESQANHAIRDDQENLSPNEKALDVILESPTRSKPSSNRTSVFSTTKSRSRFLQSATQHTRNQRTPSDTTHHRKFRRSKSDSTLPKAPKDETCDNYSEFFRSDFSMPNEKPKDTKHTDDNEASYLRVSQIEAAFNGIGAVPENVMQDPTIQEELLESDFSFTKKPKNGNTGHNESSILKAPERDAVFGNLDEEDNEMKDSFRLEDDIPDCEMTDEENEDSFDKPIFSEDLKDIIDTEDLIDTKDNDDLWQDTLPLSAIPKKDEKDYEDPQLVLHEISSFLGHPQENATELEREQLISKELEISHKIFKESEQPQINTTQENISLSHMSPDQLQFTQDSPHSPIFKKAECKKVNVYEKSITEKKLEKAKTVHKDLMESRKEIVLSDNTETLKYISAWNLPLSVLKEYERKGVKKMFDWQIQCLSNPKVLFEHCNLVYSAPTSAGKTLVSEILLLKTVLERGKKVLVILPFISVVREKMFYLQDLLTAAGYRVEGFFGGYTPPGGFDSINVAICTIEKANSIVNKLLEQGKLDEIGTVVVDEVHLISDPGRGYILELLLAKILYMSRKYALQIQVITMSATLANVELLQKWLDAELFITNFRPVALNEMIKVGNKIYDNNLKVLRSITEPTVDIREPFPLIQNDSDHVAQLCIETLIEGCSVIVFCPSKEWCENLSVQLAGAIHSIGKQGGEWGIKLRAQLKREAIDEVKKQLKDIPTGLDTVLEKTVTYGCAFHHAGLTTEERDIVEASFKSGALKIIVATSTLSSGVNLPARRVLIRSPLFGGKQMSSLTYRQMIGRAGRTGKDTLGESILICTDSNARVGKDLVTADLKPISSCLEMDSSTHLKRALLEVISSGVATTKDDIDNFVKCTLLSAQKELADHEKERSQHDNVTEDEYIGSALDFLVEYEFVRLQSNEETNEQNYVATRLGMACLASSMPPTDGLILFAELQKSRRCFVLESELHAVYLVTPYSVCYQLQDLDWLFFLDLWEKLTPAMKKVGELVGVKESFLVRAMRGQTKLDYKLMQIHKRFYTALALQELVNETPISKVAIKFKCSRGMLQSLQQMASTFAGIVTSFCNSLQWDTLSLIVSQFKERLYFGVHRDLIDLMRIPDLNHKRARALFDAGVTSLVDLANADILSIEKILYNALSFDSAKQHDDENAVEAAQRNQARHFFITGKAGITVAEAAKLIVQEARQFVQYEIGVGNINWSQRDADDSTEKTEDVLHMSYEKDKFHKVEKSVNSEDENIKIAATDSVSGNIEIKIDNEKKTNTKDYKNKPKLKTSTKINNKVNAIEGNNLMVNNQNNINEEDTNMRPEYQKIHTPAIITAHRNNFETDGKIKNKSNVKLKDMTTESGPKGVQQDKIHLNAGSGQKDTVDKQKHNHNLHKINTSKNNKAKTILNTKSNDNNITFTDDSKFLNAMKPVGDNDIQPPNNHIKTNKIEAVSIPRNSNEKRKSSERTLENNVTPPKVRKSNDNINDNPVDDEEKPSTSKKAQRLLRAKQLSEMKKQEWAKKREDDKQEQCTAKTEDGSKSGKIGAQIETEVTENQRGIHTVGLSDKMENRSTPSSTISKRTKDSEIIDNHNAKNNVKDSDVRAFKQTSSTRGANNMEDKSTPLSNTGNVVTRKSNELIQHSPNTPLSSHRADKPHIDSANGPTKLPRRSPRNHLISSTRIENKPPYNSVTPPKKRPVNSKTAAKSPGELFGDENEESFVFNTGVNDALKEADKFKVPQTKDDLNKSQEDEIPSSQQLVEDVPTNKTNSPHASRFLRSLRATQRLQSPKPTPTRGVQKEQKRELQNPQPKQKIELYESEKRLPQEPPTSTSIELSDFSMENSLMKNPMHLNASHILSCSKVETESSSFKSIDIIDICGDQKLFKGAFKEFMANKRLGFCLGVQQQSGKRKPIIGANLLLNQVAAAERDNESSNNYEFQIDDTNYLAGIGFCVCENLVYYMNMQTPGSCKGLTAEVKCKYLRMLLRSSEHCLIMFDAKEQLKVLRRLLNDLGEILISLEDPKVANWLLQPDKMHNLHSLAQQFAPECSALVNLCGSGRGYNSYGLDSDSAILAKVRCSIESCVTVHILKGQIENLERIGTGQLHKFFKELEMPLQISLCNMEDIGFPTSSETLHKLFQQMVETMKKLETKIYELHGSRFNLGSTSAVARVLGLHRKTNGRVSTSKQILEKIDTPISQMIITYRKLSVTISKNIQPLLKCVKDERIRGQSITFTSTGRISMTEPNLQNVAKDFEVEITSDKFTISCRSAFYPMDSKRGLISSDFCQLEMRILAHLSQDSALLQVMKSEKDLFVAIAARWNKIPEHSVTEQARNGTKQICYGIVYGMGIRALSEGLKCTEQEAKLVSEQFHAAYPGIRSYTDKVIKFAKNNGYIETITGRRRYLEHINSGESLMKNQAERQAVNSTIQGSAADITKSAILRMEKNITKYRDKLGVDPQSVHLVLHLHDELIFEVPEDKAKKIAKVLSVTMENCVKLSVPLKVKLKIGKSWGKLKEVKL